MAECEYDFLAIELENSDREISSKTEKAEDMPPVKSGTSNWISFDM